MRVSFLLLAAMLSCARPIPQQPVTPPSVAASGPSVTFPDGHLVRVEVVADDESRAQGLMFRDRVREGTGMLFIFPQVDEYSFWMKNTLIPLDMIWIDDAKRVVHVKHDVPPCKADPCPSYAPGVAARYILEVGAGVAKKHRIETGSTLVFEGVVKPPG
ncbi:MAG: DUF192 domain-containing protein [Thermoanaerobaculia bacterium]|nr:DUF192 domain-containing protein [Thermoanaerobaculia bacterium]